MLNNQKLFNSLIFFVVLIFGLLTITVGLKLNPVKPAHAASTYTVDSTGDEPDDNPGDNVCHTAADTCTLRAAIQEVNAGTGGDTIEFNITGTGVHTLQPASCYDDITQGVTIDGYSQPGAVANTAPSPEPFNGTLTIEIDGTSAGNCNGLTVAVNGITIKGLVVNRFTDSTTSAIYVDTAINTVISGNYIGTDTTGLVGLANVGYGIQISGGSNNTIGGLSAAARNIVSGNNGGDAIAGISERGANNIIQGNYVGLAADGVSSLGNAGGGVEIHGNNAIIGGSSVGAINVISGNGDSGIRIYGAQDSIVQGNYIGLDYTGTVGVSNFLAGITANNGATGNLIGGTTASERNVISNGTSRFGEILLFQTPGNTIQGNYLGTDKDGNVVPGLAGPIGVGLLNESSSNIIGGIGAGEGNKIAGHTNNGIWIIAVNGFGADPLNNSIIGNDIEQNTESGIRLCNDTNSDFVCDTPEPYPNDAGDPDEGPNMFMNFPVINSATKGSSTVTVNYDLDINPAEVGATGYKIAFYANTTNTREGAIFLGTDDVAGDVTGHSATLTLPNNMPSDYYITAVTTMTDASSDGLGHSSEFSAPVLVTNASTPSATLASTGQNTKWLQLSAIVLVLGGGLGFYIAKRNKK